MSRSAEAAVPYLPAVECPADLTAEGTLSVIYCEETDILKRCGEHFAEADVSAVSEIQVTERDAAGYVQQVMLGEYVCTGEAFREAMGWNSACFTITQMGENVRIVTRGLGHGYGLSQNEARDGAGRNLLRGDFTIFFSGNNACDSGSDKIGGALHKPSVQGEQ